MRIFSGKWSKDPSCQAKINVLHRVSCSVFYNNLSKFAEVLPDGQRLGINNFHGGCFCRIRREPKLPHRKVVLPDGQRLGINNFHGGCFCRIGREPKLPHRKVVLTGQATQRKDSAQYRREVILSDKTSALRLAVLAGRATPWHQQFPRWVFLQNQGVIKLPHRKVAAPGGPRENLLVLL